MRGVIMIQFKWKQNHSTGTYFTIKRFPKQYFQKSLLQSSLLELHPFNITEISVFLKI